MGLHNLPFYFDTIAPAWALHSANGEKQKYRMYNENEITN